MGLYIYLGLWDYDGRDMVFSFTSVQEEWYSTHASQKKDEQEGFTRSSLFRSGGMVLTRFPEEGKARSAYKVVVIYNQEHFPVIKGSLSSCTTCTEQHMFHL
jgi:hypothetical protein